MKFGSVCSGIEAASVAFEPLGWKAAWFSEIEPFPCAVLKHHYPDTPNYGDMTTLPEKIRSGEVEAPDLFCGGTPCQAFSVAGLRQSLSDDRGNLSLTFCEIANAIDHVRSARGEQPCIVFWENVPGVLSTTDNAFGCFLGALSGCDSPILPGRLGWTDAGVVAGPQRTVAWRVLDAQYFGLAQRRRRVFVVASARNGFNPAEVLLEFQGVRRDFAPSRETGQRVAAGTAAGAALSGPVGTLGCNTGPRGHGFGDFLNNQAVDAGHLMAFGGNRTNGPIDVAPALNACGTASGRQDFETEAFITTTHTLRGEGFDASEDGTGRGTPLVPAYRDIAPTLTSNGDAHTGYRDEHGLVPVAFHPTQDPISSQDLCHAIGANENATAAVMQPIAVPEVTATLLSSAAGFSRTGGAVTEHETYIPMAAYPAAQKEVTLDNTHAVMQAIAFQLNGDRNNPGVSVSEGKAFCLPANPMSDRGQAVAIPLDLRNAGRDAEKHDEVNRQGVGVGDPGDPSHTVTSACVHGIAVGSFKPGQSAAARSVGYENEMAPSLEAGGGGNNKPAVHVGMQVRRLTPMECERLQGFPDGYTAIPWRGKPTEECPDGPRYKALGNSWAVPCVQWIGRRIQQGVQGKVPS